MSRSSQGGQGVRAVACLPAVVGAYAKRGGGALLATVGGFGFSFEAVRRPSGPAATRLVNHSRLGEALLEMRDPPIRALFVAANNPAVTCPDSAAVRRGLMREDLFTVVHDPFVTDTARYADLVLPATTYLETEDLFRAYGAYYVQFAPQAVAPQGEAWSNVKLAQELARRLGVRDAVFSMSTPELVRAAFVGATGADAALDADALRGAGPIKIDPYPDGQRFGTPSGKLEFYSEALASQGHAPMPDWHEDAEETALGQRWPLRLLTAPGYFQSHTAFTGNRALRRREGAPVVILHPAEASRRGLTPDDEVELFNDLGRVSMRLRVSDEIAPGVVLVPGQRPAGEAVAGTVNLLCSDRLSDLGEGATYQSTFLDVKRVARV
jgi:anaerobic selenocysteine-containing dehydrogenase